MSAMIVLPTSLEAAGDVGCGRANARIGRFFQLYLTPRGWRYRAARAKQKQLQDARDQRQIDEMMSRYEPALTSAAYREADRLAREVKARAEELQRQALRQGDIAKLMTAKKLFEEA